MWKVEGQETKVLFYAEGSKHESGLGKWTVPVDLCILGIRAQFADTNILEQEDLDLSSSSAG